MYEGAAAVTSKLSRITCCNMAQPAYSPSKIVFDYLSLDDANRANEIFYLIGEPLTVIGDDWFTFDTVFGRAVLWKITNSPASGCSYAQSFALDLTVSSSTFPGFTYLEDYWGQIMDFVLHSDRMSFVIMFSNTRANLGKIGSQNNRIFQVDIEKEYTCNSGATTFKVTSKDGLNSINGIQRPWSSTYNIA